MGVPTLFRHLFESYGYEIIKNGDWLKNVTSGDYEKYYERAYNIK